MDLDWPTPHILYYVTHGRRRTRQERMINSWWQMGPSVVARMERASEFEGIEIRKGTRKDGRYRRRYYWTASAKWQISFGVFLVSIRFQVSGNPKTSKPENLVLKSRLNTGHVTNSSQKRNEGYDFISCIVIVSYVFQISLVFTNFVGYHSLPL